MRSTRFKTAADVPRRQPPRREGRKTRAQLDTNGLSTPVGRRRGNLTLSYVNKGFVGAPLPVPVAARRRDPRTAAGTRAVAGVPT